MMTAILSGFLIGLIAPALYKAAERLADKEREAVGRLRKDAEWMRDRRALRINGVHQGYFHKDDPVFRGCLGPIGGDCLEYVGTGGELEVMLDEIIADKENEKSVADERTRLYRDAHCSQCGQPLRKEDKS